MNDIKNYTLNGISTLKRDRNPLNGRFNKGFVPYNKGVKGFTAKTEEKKKIVIETLQKCREIRREKSKLGLLKRPDVTLNRSREVGYIDKKGIPHVFTNVRVAGEWVLNSGYTKSKNALRLIRRSCDNSKWKAYGYKWYFTDSDEFLEKLKEAYR